MLEIIEGFLQARDVSQMRVVCGEVVMETVRVGVFGKGDGKKKK